MKGIKITYWAATGIIAFMMVYSAYAYFTDPAVAQGFQHLGFPAYFRIELGIAKLIGAILLVAPVSAKIKEWTYAGFAITFVSAFIAHTVSGDPVANRMGPLIFLAVLVVSYVMYQKKGNKTAVATA
ncbi:DoxX family protein [Chitinophaga sp. SYP-B3965]|uniref:DoxX family protein n=1 Tax=Chitinophaga sp. SYP-B3965 TaxID=2663120 RepID=UPI001299BDCE|nr:DoxX family protein [Chitinophaga sp. SYP-B3965]MRG43839.1 DoxX family protein [Chitinophaga sp. SYP-B3965]